MGSAAALSTSGISKASEKGKKSAADQSERKVRPLSSYLCYYQATHTQLNGEKMDSVQISKVTNRMWHQHEREDENDSFLRHQPALEKREEVAG